MDLITGFATADGWALLDSVRVVISLIVSFAISIFIAFCWFAIGRKAGVKNAWLAFVPIVGHYVAWRSSRTGVWTLVLVLVAALVVPLAIVVLFASSVSLIAFFVQEPSLHAPSFAALIGSLLALVLFGITQAAIITWWTYRVARELGFSGWVGLLASPIARLIPFGGQIIRLVFLGMLALRREPF